MDAPALRKRERLIVLWPGSQKGADLVEEAAEAFSGAEGFEPTRGPVALLDAPMILLEMISGCWGVMEQKTGLRAGWSSEVT
jgi:hypothetical protein